MIEEAIWPEPIADDMNTTFLVRFFLSKGKSPCVIAPGATTLMASSSWYLTKSISDTKPVFVLAPAF